MSIKVERGRSALLPRYYHSGFPELDVLLSSTPVTTPNRVVTINVSVLRAGPYINVIQHDPSFLCAQPQSRTPSLTLVHFYTPSNPFVHFFSQFSFILSVALQAWRQSFSPYPFSP